MTLFAISLFAFGFGNLLMLGWLAAAAAPILIHLWNRRRYREMSWAAIEFLLAAMRRNARRIQIQQWLLLAVRTLIVILIVLAMAEPFMERLGLDFIAGQRTHKVLVIDGSFSMDYRPTDNSRFTRAKQLATKIVEESPQGDGFTLVQMGTPPRVVVGTPAFEPSDFLEEIENLQLAHAGADLPATLALVEEILERAQRDQPGLEHSEVYFLTDLGRNTWLPDHGVEAATAGYQGQVEKLAGIASLIVLDLGQAKSENLAVTSLKTLETFATASRDVTFEVVVQNFGNQPRDRHLVELLVEGVRVKEQFIDIPSGGQASASFTHRFMTPGSHQVEVRVAADLLDVDNHRWLALPVKPFLRVLCVSGKQGSTYYLVAALDPDRSEQSLVRPKVVAESALLELDLAEFDAIFLCNVSQFTTPEARLLEAYLKQGGGLVFFLGDRVIAERYNQELAEQQPGSVRLLPALLGDIVDETRYQFDPLGYEHPIVAPFRGRERAGLLTTPVYHYFHLTVPDEWKQSRVALAFDGGDPAIVESPIHRGRSIVVATAASLASIDPVTRRPWTTMPAWPSFLPIVQELLAHAVGSQRDQYNTRVGQSLGMSLPSLATTRSLAVSTPDGRAEQVRVETSGSEARWTFSSTDQSGIYAATTDGPTATTEYFAVNVDTAESDLAKAEPEELPKEFVTRTHWQDLDERPTGEISARSGIHKGLLYGTLVLLLVETFLAWWFGRGLFVGTSAGHGSPTPSTKL